MNIIKTIAAITVISFLLTACGGKRNNFAEKPEESDVASGITIEDNLHEDDIRDSDLLVESDLLIEDEAGYTSEGTLVEEFTEDEPVDLAEEQTAAPAKKELVLEGYVICVDAGHGISSVKKKEPIAPGSDKTKAANVPGTRGTNQTEEQLNLKVAKKLEQKLIELGADVHMTRKEANSDMSNVERAELANNINADISVRIHADGNSNKDAHGISMLVPTNDFVNNKDLVEKSESAGKLVLTEVIAKTGAHNRGISKRSDITAFNWSKVPVILLEMGFMTNPDEDKLLETEDYQDKIVQGLIDGLIKYLKN